jgi:hypothetical protein
MNQTVALVIGIEEYSNNKEIQNVQFAQNDATDIAAAFNDLGITTEVLIDKKICSTR